MSNKTQRTGIQNLDAGTKGGERHPECHAKSAFCGYAGPKHFLRPQNALILGRDVSLPTTTHQEDKEHQYAKSLPA